MLGYLVATFSGSHFASVDAGDAWRMRAAAEPNGTQRHEGMLKPGRRRFSCVSHALRPSTASAFGSGPLRILSSTRLSEMSARRMPPDRASVARICCAAKTFPDSRYGWRGTKNAEPRSRGPSMNLDRELHVKEMKVC